MFRVRHSLCRALRSRSVPAKGRGIESVPKKGVRIMSTLADPSSTFLSGSNTRYIEEMYLAWEQDPTSVHVSWDAYFKTGVYQAPPTLFRGAKPHTPSGASPSPSPSPSTSGAPQLDGTSMADTIKVIQLVRAFQVRGHFLATLDPLGLSPPKKNAELELDYYGFGPSDLDRVVDVSLVKIKGIQGQRGMTLRQIHTRLKEIYCGSIGYEYMHIPYVEHCNWIREKIETRNEHKFSKEAKLKILTRLTSADHLERYLGNKYNTTRRFGLEGAESTIPGLIALIEKSATLGVDNVVMGMPHRGRLNVLCNVLHKPLENLFYEFHAHAGHMAESAGSRMELSGDVKYHLGQSHTRIVQEHQIHISLMANPSHLEAVNPLVCGKVRAKQFYSSDFDRSKVMGVLIHGDASFSAQGVVYETLGLAKLPGYTTGGTVHIIINNQIGFTTNPTDSRSTPYCSDLAKAFNVPVFHVNGDDPEAVAYVCELAAEFRQHFQSDVVIDVVTYRKHGHNEIDEPSFTQPSMYKKIKSFPSTLELYRKFLDQEKTISIDEAKKISEAVLQDMEKRHEASHNIHPTQKDWMQGNWTGLKDASVQGESHKTGIPVERLKELGGKLSEVPQDMEIHKRIAAVYDKKKESAQSGTDVDWALAEALAFGSLLTDGTHVRLSGQDVERGTFSHRHAVLHHQTQSGKTFTPLNHITREQAFFSVHNSSLSEFGVLGFEAGYAMENPKSLVVWEAQFGDFFNGAQIIFDQFLSSGEHKWSRQNGLVVLLPHGYEGQGPEHSSARMERFLQMSNEHPVKDFKGTTLQGNDESAIQTANWQIVNCTTPANYFHALRRQIKRDFRKPLIVFSPKSLLRHPSAKSTFAEMSENTSFLTVIGETNSNVKPTSVRRIVCCSGKVYYDIAARREKEQAYDVAIVRLEQLAPFPFQALQEELNKYPAKAEIVWVQEEHFNMGAWTFVEPRLETTIQGLANQNRSSTRARYIGREPSAATATGHMGSHNKQLESFLSETFAH